MLRDLGQGSLSAIPGTDTPQKRHQSTSTCPSWVATRGQRTQARIMLTSHSPHSQWRFPCDRRCANDAFSECPESDFAQVRSLFIDSPPESFNLTLIVEALPLLDSRLLILAPAFRSDLPQCPATVGGQHVRPLKFKHAPNAFGERERRISTMKCTTRYVR